MKFLQKQKEKINNEKVIFHGRLEGNLKEIKPHKCKHDKAYVYASHNIALCIIFGVISLIFVCKFKESFVLYALIMFCSLIT